MKSFCFLLICCLFVLLSCKERASDQQKPEEPEEDYTGPLLAFQNIESALSEEGSARLVLSAPLQYREQNGDERFPSGVKIDIYGGLGRKETLILADSARYASEQRLYLMMGNVEVTNLIEQQKLETPILYWDERYREIYTDTIVKITTDKEIINGVGLRAKQDFSQYKILRPTGIISAAE